jgi:peroxiredoxin
MGELQGLQSRMTEFRAAGVRVMAISPDTVDENRAVVERFGLEFPILSDRELAATGAFGVRHDAAGIDGADSPRPATFIADAGVIRWTNVTDDYRVRPRPDDVLAAVHASTSPR